MNVLVCASSRERAGEARMRSRSRRLSLSSACWRAIDVELLYLYYLYVAGIKHSPGGVARRECVGVCGVCVCVCRGLLNNHTARLPRRAPPLNPPPSRSHKFKCRRHLPQSLPQEPSQLDRSRRGFEKEKGATRTSSCSMNTEGDGHIGRWWLLVSTR